MDRIIRNLVLVLILVVVTFNFLHFLFGKVLVDDIFDYRVNLEPTRANFMGFKHFFDTVSTFPGLTNTLEFINLIVDIVSGHHYDPVGILEILKIMVSPFLIIIYIIKDIVVNVLWFISAFLPGY